MDFIVDLVNRMFYQDYQVFVRKNWVPIISVIDTTKMVVTQPMLVI